MLFSLRVERVWRSLAKDARASTVSLELNGWIWLVFRVVATLMPVEPRSLRDFCDLVVPELRRRGLRPNEYRGPTLRDNMELVRPADPFLQGAAAG